jgi:hypothetical protein
MFKRKEREMNKKKQILLVVILAILVVTVGIIGLMNRPTATVGAKTVTVEVIHGDGAKKVFTLHTDAETLRSACDEQQLIQGEDGEYGLYVLTVDGETADDSQQQWWCITKNGEEHFYGVDDTMIENGDKYEFTLKTGW